MSVQEQVHPTGDAIVIVTVLLPMLFTFKTVEVIKKSGVIVAAAVVILVVIAAAVTSVAAYFCNC